MEFIATCAKGFEALLQNELLQAGIAKTRPLVGQVWFEGTLEAGYKACLYSRLASRVIAVFARVDAQTRESLYEGLHSFPWEEHLGRGMTCAFDAHGTNKSFTSKNFAAQCAMDGLRDRMRERLGVRVAANPNAPDLPLTLRIHNNKASVGLILSGNDPLFKRAIEKDRRELRSDYAAACVLVAGKALSWAFIDDYGKVLEREAKGIVLYKAPGLERLRWGFDAWLAHDKKLWEELILEARQAELKAGFQTEDAAHADAILWNLTQIKPGDLVKEAALLERMSACAKAAKADACITSIAPSDFLDKARTEASIASQLGRHDIRIEKHPVHSLMLHTPIHCAGKELGVFVVGSQQFAARLAKVARERSKWAQRKDISCYRVYDADLPDYAVSIELYQNLEKKQKQLLISEYAAPKEIDPQLAKHRLMDVLTIAPRILEVDSRNVSLRVRTKSKGGSQYLNAGDAHSPHQHMIIDEGGLSFELDFSQHLDCGIFLDHRDTRALIREMMKKAPLPKRFLNLFAYTGTASCYAADGGAQTTTSVDLSRPSLEVAQNNLKRNGFSVSNHHVVQADVLSFVNEKRHSSERWDLVFCDVPTFSNSARMRKHSFDVQRDHVELLIGVSRLLSPGACCIFSCNLRSFTLNYEALAKAGVVAKDITEQTIPHDFKRTPKIHSAFIISRA